MIFNPNIKWRNSIDVEHAKIEVKNEDESVQYDLCDNWKHDFCVDTSPAPYRNLKLSALPRYYPICTKKKAFSSYLIKNLICSYPESKIYSNPHPHHSHTSKENGYAYKWYLKTIERFKWTLWWHRRCWKLWLL